MPSQMVQITFSIQYATQYGEQVFIVGSNKTFGEWNEVHGKALNWSGDCWWTLQVELDASELPFEYKYVVSQREKRKKKIPKSPTEGTDPSSPEEVEIEVEELVLKWENTPNRPVKPGKSQMRFRDAWNKLPQTEAEFALEERNALLSDLKELETLIFPQFTCFPKELGSREYAIGIIGEPDKTSSKGLPKDNSRTFFMEGVLSKTSDDKYKLLWFGRQTFQPVGAEKKIDISERFTFEQKLVTFDDVASRVTVPTPREQWNQAFPTVLEKLGHEQFVTSHWINWDAVNKKWQFKQRPTPAMARFQRRIEEQQEFVPPIESVVLNSEQAVTGTTHFQVIPGTTDIVGVRTTSYENDAFTYIAVFDAEGRCLLQESYVAPMKYEGMIMAFDLDARKRQAFLATDISSGDLRKREREYREHIDAAHIKYFALKEEELQELAAAKNVI
jgi:hypothetical protein